MLAKPSVQALRGVRILSLCLNLPGPAAVMRLRAMGARCLKIEPPRRPDGSGGDPMRLYNPACYQVLHQGIRVQSLDLKTAVDQARLHRALDKTDVLITSFRPSALRKLGLAWPGLHRQHPALSMVRIVGDSGAAAEHAGHDLTYLASQHLLDSLELPATLYADMAASIVASEAVLQLVLEQRMRRRSRLIDVSLVQAAAHLALPRRFGLTGPNTLLGGSYAGYRIYRCQDGRVAVAALELHFARGLVGLIGLPWQGASMMFDARVQERVAAFMARHTCADIASLARAHDLPLHVIPD